MKTEKSFNVQIWAGLRVGYTDEVHALDDARKVCDAWVNEVGDCVTITPTEFRYVNGSEPGVVVGYINYPRFPRTKMAIIDRAIVLAEKLRVALEQTRVTVTTPEETYMLGDA